MSEKDKQFYRKIFDEAVVLGRNDTNWNVTCAKVLNKTCSPNGDSQTTETGNNSMEFDLSKHIMWPNYEALKVLVDELKDAALKEKVASAYYIYKCSEGNEELRKASENSDSAQLEGRSALTHEHSGDQILSENSSCTCDSPTHYRSLSPHFFHRFRKLLSIKKANLYLATRYYTNTQMFLHTLTIMMHSPHIELMRTSVPTPRNKPHPPI